MTVTTSQRRPVYRRPRMVPFLVTGALIGLVIGAVLAYLGPPAPYASPAKEMIAMAVTFGLFGGLFGGIAYLVVERLYERRS